MILRRRVTDRSLDVRGYAELGLLAVFVVHRAGRIADSPSVRQTVAHGHAAAASRMVANQFDMGKGAHHDGKRVGSTIDATVGQYADGLVPAEIAGGREFRLLAE